MKIVYRIKKLIFRLKLFIKYRKNIRIEGDIKGLFLGKNVYFDDDVTLVIRGGKIEIGDNCIIRKGCYFSTEGGNISIGNNCSFNPYVILYGDGGLFIGNDVRVAAFSLIVPGNHNFSDKQKLIRKQGMTKLGIEIEDDVWVGGNVSILDGVVVRKGSVLGASSVVVNDTCEYSVNVGIPAKRIKDRQ